MNAERAEPPRRAGADRASGRADPSLPAPLPLLLQPARARPPLGRARRRDLEARVQRGGRARRAACASLRRRADGAARHRRAHRPLRRRAGLYTNLITSGRRGRPSDKLDGLWRCRARPRAALLPGRRRGRTPTASAACKGAQRAQARLRRAGHRGWPAADHQRGHPSRQYPPGRAPSSISRSSSARGGSKSRIRNITAGRSPTAPR